MKSSINLNHFSILERIGKGSFGEVYKIKDKKTGEIYAAKISLNVIDEESSETIRDISREVNILSQINNISILKLIGFSTVNFQNEPKPVIITEYLSNGSLYDIINLERRSLANIDWNDTRKLITIYGIASAMAYLHSHNIVHRDLKPANILMDDFLCPKIADFGLSKMKHSNSETMSIESTLAIKGTPIYISPEIWKNMEYTKASDVYSFAIIVYEIITNQEPFKNFDVFEIRSKVKKGFRPEFNFPISESYKKLIEKCWSQDPEERPTFDQIVNELKNDAGFISDLIEQDDYLDYIDYVENYGSSFDSKKKIIQINEFIKRETVTFRKITIPKKSKESNQIRVIETVNETNEQSIQKKKPKRFSGLFKKTKSKEKIIYPSDDFDLLSNSCQVIVQEAAKDAEKQYKVGQYLIEGKNDFPKNTEIGIKYLKKSIKSGCIDAVPYYCKMLIKGDIIPKNHEKAKKILKKHLKANNGTIFLLYGKIKKKEKDFVKAMKYFNNASNFGSAEAMYEMGKMYFKGTACSINEKKATEYFEMAKKNGFDKTESFFNKLDKDYLFNYALNLYKGNRVAIDKVAAAKYLKISIEKGHDEAMLFYGQMLENGDGITAEPSIAIDYYKKASDKGNISASYNYALMLYDGKGIDSDKKEASIYFKKAADEDHLNAIIKYSQMKYDGDGIPADKKEASIYFKKAADKGDLNSIIKYSQMKYNGDGIPVDRKEANIYYKIAADKGDLESIIQYACMKCYGIDIPSDKKEACIYFKKAADKGDTYSINKYYEIIKNNEELALNKEDFIKCIKQSADDGDPDAMFQYAQMLHEGKKITRDIKEAAKYYKMAANNGNAELIFKCAGILRCIDPFGYKDAIEFYKKAADLNHTESMYKYAIIVKNGAGVKADKKEAYKYFRLAASHGHIDSMNEYCQLYLEIEHAGEDNIFYQYLKIAADNGKIESAFYYGKYLYYGIGLMKNKEKSLPYLKIAADNKYGEACHLYGVELVLANNISEGMKYIKTGVDLGDMNCMYFYGHCQIDGLNGVQQNITAGIELLKKAVNKGCSPAMYILGDLYYKGEIIMLNRNEAFKLWERCVDNYYKRAYFEYSRCLIYGEGCAVNIAKGLNYLKMACGNEDPEAMNLYATFLVNGDYVPKDITEGAYYYKKAASLGHEGARKSYDKLYQMGHGIPCG